MAHASSKQKLYFFIVAVSFVVLLPIFLYERKADPTIRIGGKIYELEIADEPVEKARGLGGRADLNDDLGMLFIFQDSGFHSFWMRGMQFALDIVWISEDFKIVHMEKSLQPDTYPQAYVSHLPAKYVLEVNAGEMFAHGVQLGSEVKIDGIRL